jgi:stress-induced morphogen
VIEPQEVEKLLQAAFPDARIELEDLTGTKDHYQALIVSTAFAGKTPVQQHQLVYRALGEAMAGPIHALALKTYTPEAYERLGSK